jgi:hypothetical protein
MVKKPITAPTIKSKAQNVVSGAKTAADLNRLISKYIDILEKGVTSEELRLIETISGLIGRQVSVENAKISYERLASLNNKVYGFAS